MTQAPEEPGRSRVTPTHWTLSLHVAVCFCLVPIVTVPCSFLLSFKPGLRCLFNTAQRTWPPGPSSILQCRLGTGCGYHTLPSYSGLSSPGVGLPSSQRLFSRYSRHFGCLPSSLPSSPSPPTLSPLLCLVLTPASLYPLSFSLPYSLSTLSVPLSSLVLSPETGECTKELFPNLKTCFYTFNFAWAGSLVGRETLYLDAESCDQLPNSRPALGTAPLPLSFCPPGRIDFPLEVSLPLPNHHPGSTVHSFLAQDLSGSLPRLLATWGKPILEQRVSVHREPWEADLYVQGHPGLQNEFQDSLHREALP